MESLDHKAYARKISMHLASADISHLELWEQATIVCLENLPQSTKMNQK